MDSRLALQVEIVANDNCHTGNDDDNDDDIT